MAFMNSALGSGFGAATLMAPETKRFSMRKRMARMKSS